VLSGLLVYNPFNRQPTRGSGSKRGLTGNLSTLNGGYSRKGPRCAWYFRAICGCYFHHQLREQYALFGVQGSQYQLDYCTLANYLPDNRQPSVAPTIRINGNLWCCA
jgi:hypothetical protein